MVGIARSKSRDGGREMVRTGAATPENAIRAMLATSGRWATSAADGDVTGVRAEREMRA